MIGAIMVLGKAYREDIILVIFLYLILLIAAVAGIICLILFMDKLSLKIALVVVLSLFIMLITYFPYYSYKNNKTPEDVIVYDAIEESITINTHKMKYTILISDISAITVHNIGTKILFSSYIEEGKLYFYLNDGTKIKTPELDNVYDTYEKLDEIVFKDREYETIIKDQLYEKLDGWGSKKEYPAIVSILVAIFLPFFGIFFVMNQNKFRELKNGKATGLMAVAFVISAIWVFGIIIALALI